MSVLLVNMSIDRVTGGGTAARTLELAKSIGNDFGEKCIVLSTDHGLDDISMIDDSEYDIVLLPSISKRFYIPVFSWGKLKKLINGVDLIHIMSHWTIINVIVYFMAKNLHKPYTFCPAGTLHIFGRSKYLKKMYNFCIGKKIIRDALCCIAITEDEKSDFYNFGIHDESIEVIPNGINPLEFSTKEVTYSDFRRRNGLHEKDKYVLFMGRLNFIKGPDILLDSFVKISLDFPNLHLILAGPDEGLSSVMKMTISEASLKNRVHLIGYIDGVDKAAAYAGAEFLVVPSRREAMSIVALEAGACSTPVILTKTCGFDEVTDVGCLVVGADSNSIYKAMQDFLSPLTNLDTIGSNFHSFVVDRYVWKKTAEQYLKIAKNK